MELILIWLVAAAIGVAVTYAIIHAAVRNALSDHYKVVRWYDMTGEWAPHVKSWKHAPRDLSEGPFEPVTPGKGSVK